MRWIAKLNAEAREEVKLRRASTNGPAPDDPDRQLTRTTANTIRPRPVRWGWQDRAPLGAVTLCAGSQGLGKSTLIAGRLAADLSRGRLDGDLRGKPSDALLVSYEDHLETTITPRLIAAEADLSRVHILGASQNGTPDLVSLPEDLERIADHARQTGARLLVVDPLVAALPGKIDAHRDQDVRRALAPLAQLAETADMAVIAVIHLRKGGSNEALDRISGSIAFTAAARSVLAFGADPTDEGEDTSTRVLAHAKSNVGPVAPSLAYEIEGTTVEAEGVEIKTSRLAFLGEHEATARDILNPSAPADRSETNDAMDWLADELADGDWHESREVKARAKAADISEKVLRSARERLGVEDRRDGFPAISEWRLPVMPSAENREGTTGEGATRKTASESQKHPVSGSSHALERTKGTTEADQAAIEKVERQLEEKRNEPR